MMTRQHRHKGRHHRRSNASVRLLRGRNGRLSRLPVSVFVRWIRFHRTLHDWCEGCHPVLGVAYYMISILIAFGIWKHISH